VSNAVLDASALLTLLQQEPGAEEVEAAVANGAAISAVNLAEVVSKLSGDGLTATAIRRAIEPLELNLFAFDASLAYQTGLLRPLTRPAGLSLGDRACIALAQRLQLPALTADRAWANLPLGITIRAIR
jgi:PIN domain nuclease of toxin-antitoxin system